LTVKIINKGDEMLRTFLHAKIHGAIVTDVHLDYMGSLTIDQDLMDKAGIMPYERIEVYNMNNGQRFATYAIIGERGSKIIAVNGAAARLAYPGDKIIIATYVELSEEEAKNHSPNIIINS